MNREKLYLKLSLSTAVCVLYALSNVTAQIESGIDPEALIEQILAVQEEQQSAISDLVLDAEYIEGKKENDGSFKEEKRFIKKVYIKYLPDTAWYHEEYLEYYKDGQLQDPGSRDKEAADRIDKKKKRQTRDISYPILRPFHPDQRGKYDIFYEGVAAEKINGYVCHQFSVRPKEKQKDLIIGDYYFEVESFHLVRVEFSPAELAKKALFKLNQLVTSIQYEPTRDSLWLPRQFDIEGEGKAAFLFGVKFSGTEYYRNPHVNSGIKADIFEVYDD